MTPLRPGQVWEAKRHFDHGANRIEIKNVDPSVVQYVYLHPVEQDGIVLNWEATEQDVAEFLTRWKLISPPTLSDWIELL